jgi:hypothetical protein
LIELIERMLYEITLCVCSNLDERHEEMKVSVKQTTNDNKILYPNLDTTQCVDVLDVWRTSTDALQTTSR